MNIIATLAYGIVSLVGGLIGYFKAGSKVSLISGGISGILLLTDASEKSPLWSEAEGGDESEPAFGFAQGTLTFRFLLMKNVFFQDFQRSDTC